MRVALAVVTEARLHRPAVVDLAGADPVGAADPAVVEVADLADLVAADVPAAVVFAAGNRELRD